MGATEFVLYIANNDLFVTMAWQVTMRAKTFLWWSPSESEGTRANNSWDGRSVGGKAAWPALTV